ncbi:YoaK family protein [Cellulomonas timonensis]|uniref:YoaK family protein n=1 Tax=Cellulomonas timonensis TaxID=1689271 RepID=UPI00082BB638|nr:YoaK family protein [Cellulomonas timonensis]
MVFESLRRQTRRHETVLLLVLTFGTGVVDAVSYLVLDRVIAGNMSGNVLLLGMGLAGAGGLQVAGPAIAFAAFWLGAQLCGHALRGAPDGWTSRVSALIAFSGVVVGLVGVGVALVPPATSQPSGLGAAAVLGACMGAQAAAARATGVADLVADAITGALVGLGLTFRDSRPDPGRWSRRMGNFALIGVGAFAGALLIRVHAGFALGLVAVLSVGVAVAGQALLARSPDDQHDVQHDVQRDGQAESGGGP